MLDGSQDVLQRAYFSKPYRQVYGMIGNTETDINIQHLKINSCLPSMRIWI
jgi:hypothetical protein